MPRLAPVTSATLPASGRSQSATSPASVWPGVVPMRTTWPETYADLADSRNASVDAMAPSAPAATYTSWAVPPRPTSLPSDRVKPSSARWATRSEPETASGGVPMTTSARAGLEAAQHRREEVAQRPQLGRSR